MLLWLRPRNPTENLTLASEPVSLSMVISEDKVEKAAWENLAKAFHEKHPNITIELAHHSNSTNVRESIYRDDFDNANGRAKHDLVLMDVVWIEGFVNDLIDLMPLVKRDDLDIENFLTSEVEVGERGNKLYRIPMYPDIGVLYYRHDFLNKAKVPQPPTLGSLSKVVSKLKKLPNLEIGYLWQGGPDEGLVANFVEMMNGFGAQWIDKDNQVRLSDDKTLEAAKAFKDLFKENISPDIVKGYDETRSLEAFLEGKTAFLRGWPGFWLQIRQDPDLQGKVRIARPFSFSGTPGVGCRGGWGLGISKKAAHPGEAWEAIKYFTSEAAQKQFVIDSGLLPSREALFKDANIIHTKERYLILPKVLEYLKEPPALRPAVKQYRKVSKILQNSLQDMLWGNSSVEEAMKKAQEETNKLLRSSKNNT
jgi:multiple sugar transport system substrate-binding protein